MLHGEADEREDPDVGTSQGIGRAAAERLANEGIVKTKLTIR